MSAITDQQEVFSCTAFVFEGRILKSWKRRVLSLQPTTLEIFTDDTRTTKVASISLKEGGEGGGGGGVGGGGGAGGGVEGEVGFE